MRTKLAHFRESVGALPVWVCGITALTERHRIVESYFHQLMQSIVPQDSSWTYVAASLKSTERIREKATLELAGNLHKIDDVLRSTFVVDSFSAMKQLDTALQAFAQNNQIGYERRNKFTDADPGKFRSIVFKFDFGNHCLAEVQLSIKAFDDIYDTTHTRYEQIRQLEYKAYLTADETALFNQLLQENSSDHQKAWQSCQAEYLATYHE